MLEKPFPWLTKWRTTDNADQAISVTGQRIVLREKRIEDACQDYTWRTDEELANLDATMPLTMSFSDFLTFSKEEHSYPNPLSKRFAIETLGGRHIGNCMYYDIDLKRREAELGIMIGDRDYWAKGYGTEAVRCLLTHIFTGTTMSRVYLHTLQWNHRARKSFAKSGFKELEPIKRNNKTFILMEVFRREWQKQIDNEAKELLGTRLKNDG